MFLRKCTNKNTGRTYLSIVQGYRTTDGKSRTKTIKSLGYVDELEKEFDDPISHFTQQAQLMDQQRLSETSEIRLSFPKDEQLQMNAANRKNYGYAAASKIYHQLGVHTFLINRQRHSGEQYDANAIMKMLVFMRLIAPASKKKTFENKDSLFENSDFSLDDVYRSLSFFHKHKKAMMLWLHRRVQALYGRDTSLVYYDVTNYYFEINGPEGFEKKKNDAGLRVPDGFRKKGVCKEHRPDPIVQMGLLIDNNGIPVTYQLFPGNTNDCMTYRPCLSDIKKEYELGRIVVVADKGLNTSDNIWYTLSAKDGYVFSMSVRGADKKTKEYVLEEDGYVWLGSEYKRKSRLYPRDIKVTSTLGKKLKKTVHEKQVVFYSEKYDKRAKAERAAVIAKAQDMIASPWKYTQSTSCGAAGYVKNVMFDKETGEILDTGKVLELDKEKLALEEALDGYYLIVTSEYKESDDRIIEMYRGLWKIEESFRVTKSDLEARPVYVSRKDHIEAHFLTCFIALIIIRILEMKTEYRYSAERILRSLAMAECSYLQQNYYVFDFYNEVLQDIGDRLDLNFSKKLRSLSEIKNILASVKY